MYTAARYGEVNIVKASPYVLVDPSAEPNTALILNHDILHHQNCIGSASGHVVNIYER